MKYQDEMNLSYKYFCDDAPEVDNPYLNKNQETREQLVTCGCMKSYRIFVNGTTPISDLKMLGVVCPHCGQPAENWICISGHSAGCFNATVRRY